MIKWALTITLLLTVGTVAGTADVVDFASLGGSSCDIGSSTSIGGHGCTIGNVTFFYDDFNDPTTNGTAYIDRKGITGFAGAGGLGGSLDFLFNAIPSLTPGIWTFGAPISGGLVFQFSLFTKSGPLQAADGALTSLNPLGDSATAPTDAAGNGTLAILYPSGPYNVAGTYFTADQTVKGFNVSDLTYNTPEPGGTWVLLTTGLLVLGFGWSKLLKRRP